MATVRQTGLALALFKDPLFGTRSLVENVQRDEQGDRAKETVKKRQVEGLINVALAAASCHILPGTGWWEIPTAQPASPHRDHQVSPIHHRPSNTASHSPVALTQPAPPGPKAFHIGHLLAEGSRLRACCASFCCNSGERLSQ